MVNLSNPASGLRVRLIYNDKVLHETNTNAITGQLEIGRSSACLWPVPAADSLISSHHAVLVREGQDVVLRDKDSKNGTWFEGKRITEKKIKAGDHFTLGHCILKVEKETAEAVTKHQVELEVLTGNQRGEVKPITADKVIMGTSPEADLLLTDELVSRQHAVIQRRNQDSYWIKAFATTNGTKVNDVPLRADQERLLKDGDRIALAHVEIAFHDSSTRHDHKQTLRRLGVMVAAVVVFMSLYFGWQLVRSSAAKAVTRAQALKEAGNFSKARAVLDGAITRRGYRDVQLNAELLRTQIGKCETTSLQWEAVRQQLKNSDWTAAASQLGTLESFYNDNDAWSWQDGAVLREQSRKVKDCLDAYMDAGHPENLPVSALAGCAAKLDAAIKQMASEPDLSELLTAANERQKTLQQLITSYAVLNAALQTLGQPALPDAKVLKSSLAEIESCRTNSAATVRQRVENLLPLVRQLAASYDQYHAAVRLAQELKFKEIKKLPLTLPAPEDCMADARLFDFRKNLETAWAALDSDAKTVNRLVGDLSARYVSVDAEPADLACWRNAALMGSIYQCDSLALPFPKRTRTEASGEYDAAVGIEYFYSWLRALGSENMEGLQEPQFETRVAGARDTVAAAQALVNFFPSANEKAYLQGGQISQWLAAARRALQSRDDVVAQLTRHATGTTGREAIIAGGIALSLMDEPDASLSKNIATQLTALRATVVGLNDQRESAPLEKRIELRKTILLTGLPGDPIVNQMWIESASAGDQN